MKKLVVISAVAEQEIERAATWHEKQREGLGQEFYDKVLEGIERIETNPEGYAKMYLDARRVQLQKFRDWSLWFRIMPDKSLVIACLSAKRHPRLALERALGVKPYPESE